MTTIVSQENVSTSVVFDSSLTQISEEPNDTLLEAVDSGISSDNLETFFDSGFIGDNPDVTPNDDVDLIQFQLDAGDQVTIDIDANESGSELDPILRLFDSSGNEVAVNDDFSSLDSFIDFTASVSDTYFVGVSSFSNFSYDPFVEGSGSGGSTGNYDIEISIFPPTELMGTPDDDILTGTNDNDLIKGFGGDDFIQGLAGNDQLLGGGNNDIIIAGSGNDKVTGNGGRDNILGESGDDTIDGGNGKDTISGGEGLDSIYGGGGRDLIFGGQSDDILSGGARNDTVIGNDGQDVVSGNRGNDLLDGGNGKDTINGGEGLDSLYGGEERDLLNGGTGDDFLDGGNGKDTINGGEGLDSLYGDGGRDLLNGGTGDDFLRGGARRDTLTGGLGNDSLNGDTGNDILVGVKPSSAGGELGFGAGEIDTLKGGRGRDTFVLGDETNVFYDDGDTLTNGKSDFALIVDFNSNQDVIQLSGTTDFYRLDFFTSSSGTVNADLIFDAGVSARGEVIASLQDISPELSLSDSSFTFV